MTGRPFREPGGAAAGQAAAHSVAATGELAASAAEEAEAGRSANMTNREGGAAEGPPSDAVVELLSHLRESKRYLDGGDDPLECARGSLAAVMKYLNSFPEVRCEDLQTTLLVLMNVISDRLEGGKPPLLFDRPPPAGNRPTDQSFDLVRAIVAIAVELLLKHGGRSRKAAGDFVARLCDAEGLRQPDGKRITRGTALNWRDRSTDRSDPVWRWRVEFEPAAFTGSLSTHSEAEARARKCIHDIGILGLNPRILDNPPS
jgi:hypothetical protein